MTAPPLVVDPTNPNLRFLEEVARETAFDEPIERARLAPKRRHQPPAARGGFRHDDFGPISRPRLLAGPPPPADGGDGGEQQDAQQCPWLSVHLLSSRPIRWPFSGVHTTADSRDLRAIAASAGPGGAVELTP